MVFGSFFYVSVCIAMLLFWMSSDLFYHQCLIIVFGIIICYYNIWKMKLIKMN